MTLFKSLVCGVALCLIAGCSSLLTSAEPPPAIYVLHPKLEAKLAGRHDGVLQVSRPAVPAGFDTDRIALYWDNGRRLDYYAGAKWPTRLDDLLQDFISRSARAALPGVSVITSDLDIPARNRLAVKVLEFQPVYTGKPGGTPVLYAALQFTLISLPDEKPLLDFTVADHRQTAGDDLTAITSGLEDLLQGLLTQGFEKVAPHLASQPENAG